jgi:hypothetical protein
MPRRRRCPRRSALRRRTSAHVGTWQRVEVDPKDPAKRTPNGQTWIVREDCDVSFHEMNYRGPGGNPTERLLFDPKTGQIDQSRAGGGGPIRMGRYTIEGDLLTMNLNDSPASPRPPGLARVAGSTLWHLQRVEGSK